MPTPSQYYVDPLNGSDSTGVGTIGNPWKSAQKALNTITRNATDGDQINVRNTAADVLSAPLSFTTYGAPTGAAPFSLRGYSSVANDGGRALINGGANSILSGSGGANAYYTDVDFKTDAGTFLMASSAQSQWFTRCKFLQGRTAKVLWATFFGCLFDTESGFQCVAAQSDPGEYRVYHSYFKGGGASSGMLSFYRANVYVQHCIFNVANGYVGIDLPNQVDAERRAILMNNSLYGNNGNGTAIRLMDSSACSHVQILNNLISGFPSGRGVWMRHSTNSIGVIGNNAFYNVGTPKTITGKIMVDLGTDITLASQPFIDPANGDFRVTDVVKGLAFPSTFLGSNTPNYLDIGAAQRQEAGGGGSLIGSNLIVPFLK